MAEEMGVTVAGVGSSGAGHLRTDYLPKHEGGREGGREEEGGRKGEKEREKEQKRENLRLRWI